MAVRGLVMCGVGVVVALLAGCGGNTSTGTPPPAGQHVVIIDEPQSQTVPIGQAATFSVTAIGSAPLQYQWSEDGTPIQGATSASLATSAVAAGDSGSTFEVTVSNSINSVTSSVATLTAGPRAPAAGDLRYLLFEQVTAPGLLEDAAEHTNITGSSSFLFANAIGTTLTVGNDYVCYPGIDYDCGWSFTVYTVPAGQLPLSMFYGSGSYEGFVPEVQSLGAANIVINSIDLEPANDNYALGYVETAQAGGFDYRLEVVPASEVQATVANDGAESRVVTAVSFDENHQANVISYGWTKDTTTVYEAQTYIASSAAEIVSQSEAMAASGYFISAFGGNDTDGYMLIGTRVKGDTMARPISVTTSGAAGQSSFSTIPAQSPPYATQVIAGGFFGTFTTASSTVYVSEE